MGLGIIKLEHIGIAGGDADAEQLFNRLFDRFVYKTEEVASERVQTKFYRIGETKVELLEGLGDDDAISKFIEKRGRGIHHLAFEVEDIYHAFEEAKRMGFVLLNDQPKQGADNKMIFFIHPKSTGGVLIELCQERG